MIIFFSGYCDMCAYIYFGYERLEFFQAHGLFFFSGSWDMNA
jgi:hypothetical protein